MTIPDFKSKLKGKLEDSFIRLSKKNPKVTSCKSVQLSGKGKWGRKEDRPCYLN